MAALRNGGPTPLTDRSERYVPIRDIFIYMYLQCYYVFRSANVFKTNISECATLSGHKFD